MKKLSHHVKTVLAFVVIFVSGVYTSKVRDRKNVTLVITPESIKKMKSGQHGIFETNHGLILTTMYDTPQE